MHMATALLSAVTLSVAQFVSTHVDDGIYHPLSLARDFPNRLGYRPDLVPPEEPVLSVTSKSRPRR